MKSWTVDYSIRYRTKNKTEENEECFMNVQGENITIALGRAMRQINELHKEKQEKIDQVVIWNIGMIDEDVF